MQLSLLKNSGILGLVDLFLHWDHWTCSWPRFAVDLENSLQCGLHYMEFLLVYQVDKDLREMLVKRDAPKPKLIGLRIWPKAIPQFNVGHQDLLEVKLKPPMLCSPQQSTAPILFCTPSYFHPNLFINTGRFK